VPVHGADVVTGQVAADFLKIQPPATQTGGMPAGQKAVYGLTGQERETLGLELQPDKRVKVSVDAGSCRWF
jgi:hypothetical protein